MADSLQRLVFAGMDSPQSSQGITEADVLITEVLASRPAREPDLAAENEALRTLAQHLIDAPQSLLKTLVRMALNLCRADSVGVSLLETTDDGESVLRWVAIAGILEQFEQTTSPGNFSPCGTTLACNQPQLYSYPERYFTYLAHPQFPLIEALVIPLRANNCPLGTLWIITHDRSRHFDAEDRRLMMSLGGFTAAALYSMQQLQQNAEKALRQSEDMNQQILDSSDDCIKVLDLEGRILFMSQGGQRLLGIEDITPFLNQSWAEFWQGADRQAVNEAIDRARAGEVCTFQGYRPTLSGEPKWWDSKVSPIRGAQGQIERLLCISRDISDRKRQEANLTFLADLSEDFSRLSTANEIMQVVGAKIGAYLKITTCNFTDVDEAGGVVTVHYGWNSPDVPSTVGTFRIKEYLSQEFERASRAGETVVIRNTQNDSRTDAPGYAALNMYSFVTVPFHRNGKWTHYVAICDSRARDWRNDEIELIEEISNRIFPRLERARTEDALRQSEAKYRSLFESMDEGFCILELIFDEEQKPIDYRYIEINPVFEQQTGMQNALGRTVRELVPNIEPFWADIYGRVALTGEPTRFVDHARSMGRWFDVYAFRIGQPHERKVAVLFNDISDRKQAEAEREQLLANERQYANQLQGLTNAALAINSALSVEEVLQVITNQAASIICVHQSVTSMTIDQNWVQAITTVYLSEKYADWRDYKEEPDGSGIYACVCHLNRPMRLTQAELEAHPRWKGFGKAADKHPPLRGWLAAPLVGRDGQNIGLIQLSDKYEGDFTPADESMLVQLAQMASVAVENARLYQAEQQARAAAEALREEAEAANRVKDEFLAVLSHELRSPLNPILGWAKLLQSRKLDEAKTVQALSTIERNAKLQSELIEDLLDVSRILQGKLSLNVHPVNLVCAIGSALETVRLAAEAKSIDLQWTIDDLGLEAESQNRESKIDRPNFIVLGDSTRLQQVIWNLLSNAVKFTPEGGQVEISLSLVNADGQRTNDKGLLTTYAQITVSDNGMGIAPDFLPFVFDYFRQANSTTTRKFGGLGLGLAIVRHLVELHGGTVRVESPGVEMGTTFTVRLPLLPKQAPTNQSDRSSESSSDLKGFQVLVVDDEPDSQEFVAFVLEQAGAEVITATTANEALTTLVRSQPDILLSDIGMPDMDGYMLLQQVRTLSPAQGGQIPAIALTAYAGDFNQQQAFAVGFQKHLAKPIEPETLVATIVALLSQKL